MTLAELKRTLEDLGVSKLAYDFEGDGRDEAYCLEKTSSGWAAYYRERGRKRNEKLFPTEDTACCYVLDLLAGDPTTRFPELPGWTFDLKEVSAGVYRVRAVAEDGRSVEMTGTDPEKLLEHAVDTARQQVGE